MGTAAIAVVVVIAICAIWVYIKERKIGNDVGGPCRAPENSDVKLDVACHNHLELSNSELPASLND